MTTKPHRHLRMSYRPTQTLFLSFTKWYKITYWVRMELTSLFS